MSIKNGTCNQASLQWSEFVWCLESSHPKSDGLYNSLSRIDYLLSSREASNRVKACNIKAMTISDHSLISLVLTPPYYDPSARLWHLSPPLLSNPAFSNLLEELKLYFSTNDTLNVSASTLWVAAKAYIRGVSMLILNPKFLLWRGSLNSHPLDWCC